MTGRMKSNRAALRGTLVTMTTLMTMTNVMMRRMILTRISLHAVSMIVAIVDIVVISASAVRPVVSSESQKGNQSAALAVASSLRKGIISFSNIYTVDHPRVFVLDDSFFLAFPCLLCQCGIRH